MTRQLRRLSIVMLAMFLALFVSTSWIQVVEAESLGQHDENRRTLLDSYEIQRGSIVASGIPIATSVPSGDAYSWQRLYTDGPLWAQVTGYFNPALVSSTGIERALSGDLSGTGASAFFASIERILSGQPQRGSTVELTLDAAAQRAAYEALSGLKGGVLAIEPATGRILAMVSTPSFDVNELAVHNFAAANTRYDELEADPDDPLYNRAIAGDLNPPGSVFKLVVAAAALETGLWAPDSEFPNPVSYTLPGTSTPVTNYNNGTCGSGETATIETALRLSCNTIFAQLAVAIGEDVIGDMAAKFGFDTSFETPLTSTASVYPRGLSDDKVGLSGFGQGDVRATPLQMAMVSAGIANDGVVMNPYLVDAVLANDLSVLRSYEASEFDRAISEELAATMTAMMVDGVKSGAATGARIDGVAVAGKTGTAENGPGQPYSLWFTGFAPADNPQIAIAVVVEDGGGRGQSGTGNAIAAPIAKRVIEAVLNR